MISSEIFLCFSEIRLFNPSNHSPSSTISMFTISAIFFPSTLKFKDSLRRRDPSQTEHGTLSIYSLAQRTKEVELDLY